MSSTLSFVVRALIVSAKRKPELFLLNESHRLIQFIAVLQKTLKMLKNLAEKHLGEKSEKLTKNLIKT